MAEPDSPLYPDCRKEFYDIFNELIKKGTKKKNIKILTPLIDMKKNEIIKKGLRLGAPLHLTWSCFKNNSKACGVCKSCTVRFKGFKEAKIKDPIEKGRIKSE